MRSRVRIAAAAALAIAVTSCGGAQTRRSEALERRVATLEDEVTNLRREMIERDQAVAEAASRGSGDDVTARLEELGQTIADLRSQLDRRPPPAPSRPAPDPSVVYAVPIDGYPSEGPRHAKVTLVMSFEFACRFCRKSWDTMAELRKKYGNDLRIVYKSFVVHPAVALAPARAACAAHKQDRWKEMAQAIWDDAFANSAFDDATLIAIARRVGLDMGRFERDFRGGACATEVSTSQAQMTRLGQGGTPAFWINGRFLSGAQPTASFEVLVDEELAKADQALKRGVKLRDYYDSILKSGKTE